MSEADGRTCHFDVVVVGGGPAGATAAQRLAEAGHRTALVERGGRIKPCGGAIPPRLIEDFAIPDALLRARIRSARMIAPSGRRVDMAIEGGFVGMVDRDEFDEWLRRRAEAAGAVRITARVEGLSEGPDGTRVVELRRGREAAPDDPRLSARLVVGADGARSTVGRCAFPACERPRCVFAYHEVVAAEPLPEGAEATRCDVVYDGAISPDFYGWVFPHGETASIGTGSALKGHPLRAATARLRARAGFEGARTIRREGAPIPMRPRRRWDDGRGVILAGDAAGVVAPASGEGIYYAMHSAELVAEAASAFLATGDARHLRAARRRFMRGHGRIFRILGALQAVWYRSDWLRERFVLICRDEQVQRMTWESYMHKRISRGSPAEHARILWQNMSHFLGWRSA